MTPDRGTRPYEQQVRGYLADCERSKALLDARFHPTPDGAVKLIFHRADKTDAAKIRETFAALRQSTN